MTVIAQRAAAVSDHRGSPGPDPAQPGKEPTMNVTPDSQAAPVHAPLPEQAPYPFTTADRMPAWLALLEEESARRGLSPVDAP